MGLLLIHSRVGVESIELEFSQVAELVDARGSNGNNSQLEAMLEGRYYNYRFESCPDYD